MDTLWHDLRSALRSLAKSPGFTVVAVLTLALGIGATTGVFSAVHAVLLASMPYPEPDRLVLGRRTQDGEVGWWVAMLDYFDYREQATCFTSLAACPYGSFRLTATGDGTPEYVNAQTVSVNLFSTLGITPILGRTFTAEESALLSAPAGAPAQSQIPPAAIISFGYWQRRFAGSREVVGRTLQLMGQPVTVVGVMPEGFRLRDDGDVWLPMQETRPELRRAHNWLVVGRLKPGVTTARAQGEIDAISKRLEQLYPDSNKGKGLHLDSLHEVLVENLRPQLFLIMAAVTVMLLIASGNVASLLLVRGVSRRSEFAMRVALGASRGRLVSQLVTESTTLALLGGILGLALASLLQRVLPPLLGLEALGITSLRLDLRMLAFTAAVSVFTGLLVGLTPALRSTSVSPSEELKGGSRSVASGGSTRLRMALVATQVTLSLVLLVGSSLLIRSFTKLVHAGVGFDPDNLLTATFMLPPGRYPTDESRIQFYREMLADIRAIPGVTAAGMINRLPISDPGGDTYVWTPENPPKERGIGQTAVNRKVLPGYFTTMGMTLVAGRDFNDGDRIGGVPALIIDQTMARTLFGSQSPVGRQVVVDMFGDEPVTFDVVGVVADAQVNWVGCPPYPTMYHSYYQFPRTVLSVVIRTAADPRAITGSLRNVVWRRDKDIPVDELATMRGAMCKSTLVQQTLTGSVTAFSVLALLLAAVGLFGVLAYQVSRREHEIGIRMALGAQRHHIIAAVLGQGLTTTAIGLVVGIIVGLALTRLMTGLLYGVAPTDPASFMSAAACLLAVATVACLLPALRALAVQPTRALRYE
jgi:putative ABC transport system permease protein